MSDVSRQFFPMQQIAYVPNHARSDVSHADVEFGFVTSVKWTIMGQAIYCRYWSRNNQNELRTKANSEAADADNIVPHVSHSDDDVVHAWMQYVPCRACGSQAWYESNAFVRCRNCGEIVMLHGETQ